MKGSVVQAPPNRIAERNAGNPLIEREDGVKRWKLFSLAPGGLGPALEVSISTPTRTDHYFPKGVRILTKPVYTPIQYEALLYRQDVDALITILTEARLDLPLAPEPS